MIFFDKEYEWRDGSVYMFMTLFSNALEKMKDETKLSEKDCLLLIHVRSFRYFTVLGVKKTSMFKDSKAKVLRLVKQGYMREILKSRTGSQGVFCISMKGDEVCERFYRNLLDIK